MHTMNTVLIVDDDESFLLSLIEGFKSYESQFGIITAHNGEEAVDILSRQPIQLVLTDLKMPKMDGFALVAYIGTHHSDIPVIVMTAFGTPDIKEHLQEAGALQYIEKPIDFNLLVSKIVNGLKGRSNGFITGVSLSSFAQLLELDKKSCTVTVLSPPDKGQMYFKDGALVDASTGNLSGIEAAFAIFEWKNVEIVLTNSCPIGEPKIHKSLGFILLERSRRRDEQDSPATLSTDPSATGSSLDSIDLTGVELEQSDFLRDDNPPPAPSAASTQQANPILRQFISMLETMPEITESIIVSKAGNVLFSAKMDNDQIANFITYLTVVSQQLQIAMETGDAHYIMLTLKDNSNLLVLSGKEVVAGLKIASSVAPDPVADGLRPVLSRLSLQ